MPGSASNVIAKAGDDVTFTLTPQTNGNAYIARARLFDSNNKLLQEWLGQNVIQFKASSGASTLYLAYFDGPVPETWDLSYTTAGVTTTLWAGLSIQTAPRVVTVFGN